MERRENKMKNFRKIGVLAIIVALVFAFAACGGKGDDKVIKVAASPSPHADILRAAADTLAEEGWTLEVKEMEDYITPNTATTDGDVDANYFQHVPYLESYNAENGTDLVAVANMHYEKMGIYAGKKASLDELADGDQIAVPNDGTNELRALRILEDNGLIKLKADVGTEATKLDIADNPKNLDIVEVEAAQVPNALADVAFGVINANYAFSSGVIDKLLVVEGTDQEQEDTYVNIIVVNAENKDSEKTKALVEALHSDAVKQYIEDTFQGVVVVKF